MSLFRGLQESHVNQAGSETDLCYKKGLPCFFEKRKKKLQKKPEKSIFQ